jgi:hypothetical protein
MSSVSIKPQNLPETLVWYYILGTYVFYFTGLQFVAGPILGGILAFLALKKWWLQTESTPLSERITIPISVWVWLIATLVIEFALIVGHLDFNLGLFQILKSTLLWYRTWFLLALFPLAGCLNIRPQLVCRATCILCLQSLILIFLIYLPSVLLNLPELVYTSPLKFFGSPTTHYDTNVLLRIGKRLVLFAPWPTYLGILGNTYFFLALHESDRKWRWIGIVTSMLMIVLSVSRLAVLSLPIVLVSLWIITNIARPWVQILAGFLSFGMSVFLPTLLSWAQAFKDEVDRFRSGSSQVREAIYQMTLDRWWQEAIIWGHGMNPEKGPAYLADKPFGSHHTWYGILYSHGLVGLFALAIAFAWTVIDLVIKAQRNQVAKIAFAIVLSLLLGSLIDNLNFFSYLYYPGLILLGIALKQDQQLPTLESEYPVNNAVLNVTSSKNT